MGEWMQDINDKEREKGTKPTFPQPHHSGKIVCPECEGKGKVRRYDYELRYFTCSVCNGTGKINSGADLL